MMDHDTVFRAALIIETVETRISAKSQRKFAILTVSDGIERIELPIWSDLYEEKGQLLKENQLLYAVLQVDKKEETTRLSCRWFDDLTQANEGMIQACDRAYDHAKSMALRYAKAKKNPKAPEKKVEKMTTPKLISLRFDADQIRLSQILMLKQLFTNAKGEMAIALEFEAQGRIIATVHVDSRLSIKLNDEIQQSIKQIPAFRALSIS